MKIVLIVCLSILHLYANNFKYYIYITPSMDKAEIIKSIENVNNGTVVIFGKGLYNLDDTTIKIHNKENIVIQGELRNSSSITGLSLSFNKVNNLKIIGLSFRKSLITFKKSKKIYISDIELSETQIKLNTSSGLIQSIKSETDYKYPILYVKNSLFDFNNIQIRNNSGMAIQGLSNSTLQIKNSRISSTKIALYIRHSKLHLLNNKFINTKLAEKKSIFVYLEKSNLIAIKNQFKNNQYSIRLYDSIGYIEKNNFEKNKVSIEILSNSNLTITQNRIKDALSKSSYGIFLEKSNANINKNDFASILDAIYLFDQSSANISQNKIGNLTRETYKKKNGEWAYSNGLGISISENCLANIIENTSYNLKNPDLGVAGKGSKVFVQNNDKNIYFSSKYTNSNKKLLINVEVVQDFRKNFMTSEIMMADVLKINYKTLTIHKVEKEIKKNPNTIKGYLIKDILVNCGEYEEVIGVGNWIEFNLDNKTLIAPSEYKGKTLDETPQVNIDAEHREIHITTKTKKTKTNKVLLSFQIRSNVDITYVELNGKKMKFRKDKNILLTKFRSIKKLKNIHHLKLSNEKFEENYDCKYQNDFTCNKKILNNL